MAIERANSEEKRHPIQVASRRTGLTPEVIRVWEKRYSAVEPGRTATERRLYSDRDIERLRLLRQATLLGRRIGSVSPLDHEELSDLVAQDQAAEREVTTTITKGRPSPSEVDLFLEGCLEAIRSMDATRLEAVLKQAVIALSAPALIEDLLAPLARTIGQLWADGTLSPSHEHMATALIRQTIGEILRAAPVNGAPKIIVSTPSGERHEIGAMLAAAAALGQGWRTFYLGPDLPGAEIALAVEKVGASAVALSIVHPTERESVEGAIQELATHLPEGVAILVGGPGAAAHTETITQAGGRILPDTRALRIALGEIEMGR